MLSLESRVTMSTSGGRQRQGFAELRGQQIILAGNNGLVMIPGENEKPGEEY